MLRLVHSLDLEAYNQNPDCLTWILFWPGREGTDWFFSYRLLRQKVTIAQ